MWRGIVGHDDVAEQFRRTLAAGRLASTYLFVGPPGVGKRRFALELAHALLCSDSPDETLEPCERCESCRLLAAGTHPDLDVVGKRPDRSELVISQFIGYDEHSKQEGLCHRIALKPFYGNRRIAIVDDADHFNIYSANCLLKTLEEPPESSLLILLGTSPARQLPTIRSRSQIVLFKPLPQDAIGQILQETGAVTDAELASRAAALSDGSIERALRLSEAELWQFRDQLLAALNARWLDRVRLARAVLAFADEAGKEAARRRERLRTVVGFALDFYRAELRRVAQPPHGSCANEWFQRAEPIVRALDGCLAALEHLDRNANPALAVQAWCEELPSHGQPQTAT